MNLTSTPKIAPKGPKRAKKAPNLTEVKAEKASKKVTKRAKKVYENRLAKDCKANPKAFFRYINSKKSNRENIGPLKIDNVIVDDDNGIANNLNSFFSSVFTIEDIESVPDITRLKESVDDLSDICFHELVVKKKLLNLKPFSSPGPDNI